jgi:lipid II:glycine glycyltransferase (peptidoglycan interpeptide bridge formation enzyme)
MAEGNHVRNSKSGVVASGASPFVVHFSNEVAEPAWDAFVSALDGGNHMQTGMWAEVKSTRGWGVCRMVARRNREIAGGAQVLIRRLPVVGAIGYVPRGPVLAEDDPVLMGILLDTLRTLAREQRIHYVLVQPPHGQPRSAALFETRGFRPSVVQAAPSATVLIDLTRSTDELMARMKGKTRYNVRLGLRKGVTVRSGAEPDLAIFHRLLVATGRRNAFPIHPLDYYVAVWRVFEPRGCIKLFVAELNGVPLAALLALTVGNTVTYWRGAWAGEHGALHPNEALHWNAMQWAKQRGFHWYDLDGIEVTQAKGLARQMPGEKLSRADTSFKLGFGGDYRVSPGASEFIANPALRWASSAVFSATARNVMARIEAAIRGMSDS